jgi:hypothetical protein
MLNTKTVENYNANDVIASTDLKKHIINVDSRFRNTQLESPTNFIYQFAHPYKNIIRMRVASVEIPQPWYAFSATKRNIAFSMKAYDITDTIVSIPVAIAPANYTTSSLVGAIQAEFDRIAAERGVFFDASLNPVTQRLTIRTLGCAAVGSSVPTVDPSPFTLDFTVVGYEKRAADWGLGYNLGFRDRVVSVDYADVSASTDVYVVAPCPVDVTGDLYALLGINEYYTVEHRTNDDYVQALAKVICSRTAGGSILFDSGYTVLTNDYVFPSPADLKSIQIRLVDAYGVPVELACSNFSFSLEVTEVTNLKLYETYRNYLWLDGVPRVSGAAGGSKVGGYLPLPSGY